MNHKSNITAQIIINSEMRTITHTSSDTTISMRPLLFKVLLYLLERQGQCISRDELFEECWQGVLVTDQSLTNTISYIRKVIKNLDTDELELKTISKKGYSLSVTESKQVQQQLTDRSQVIERNAVEATPENDILDNEITAQDVKNNSPRSQQLTNNKGAKLRSPR